jgi:hypothetical protein
MASRTARDVASGERTEDTKLVEISQQVSRGLLRVMTGNALIEENISAYPPKADICALMSTRP